MPQSQQPFYFDLPTMDEKEKATFGHITGHFTVRKVVGEYCGGRFLVKLASGEKQLVTSRELRQLTNGSHALKHYHFKLAASKRRFRSPPETVNWDNMALSDSGGTSEAAPDGNLSGDPPLRVDSIVSESDRAQATSGDDDTLFSEESQPKQRRSSRNLSRRPNYSLQYMSTPEYEPRELPRRTRGRPPVQRGPDRRRRSQSPDSDFLPEPTAPTRRSERHKEKQQKSMREKHEDDIDSRSEVEAVAKGVGAKESFLPLHDDHPFRRRHNQVCDMCQHHGDHHVKGIMVYCQGCTNSYHKQCLGYRGARAHLVTKVDEGDFVLQCRRCIGVAHEKDKMAPHQGFCVACNEPGPMAHPLRERLTPKQEQQLREKNDGQDPITHVNQELLNNVDNVLFRCHQCQRAWHLHHLPPLNATETSSPGKDDGDDTLDNSTISEKQFQHYSKSWSCKECIENESLIDAMIAWRPLDLESDTTELTCNKVQECQKEYLIKWKDQSYLHASWMPGTWVWAVASSAMRIAFNRKSENKQPRMTTKDAIPRDFFRVDIVFDADYSSDLATRTREIDMARAKDVELAYIKFKGLGYEDAVWEKPPSHEDGDLWECYQAAYADYVLKLYTHIPCQDTLRSHLAAVRTCDFESKLLKKTQPALLTGGELMEYQMEGLNWLYYQWYSNQNAILADEMGLGKTIQLVSFFSLLVQEHHCWPFLVVVPNSTCPNWRREIQKWAPSLRAVCYYGSSAARILTHDYELFPDDERREPDAKSSKKKAGLKDIRAHVVIASYESIVEDKTRQSLLHVPWQGLIVDEGQRLKNDKNLLYDCLGKFNFPFKVLLSGTPLQNNIRELFNIIQFLDKSVNAAEMEERYATLTKENIPELHAQLRKFFLRRTKAKVLTFLPPMAQIIVPITMTPLQKKLYRSILAKNPALMKSIFSRDGVVSSKERVNLNSILMQLRKTLCHPFVYSRQIEERSYDQSIAHRSLVEASSKLQLLSIMLPKLQERGHRVLMFSQFIDNLDIMEDFLEGLNLQYLRLDGNTTSVDKQKKIDEFNAPNSDYFAFLLSTRAGGVGINLATADTVIILDPDFNPHQDIQALSRAHRIGQQKKVLVFQLVTKASAEEKILQIGKKKMALDHVLIDSMERNGEDAVDLESILRHGADALFQDESQEEDIIYDSESVDRLLDRSQVEVTKANEDTSAESQFSYARVWAYKTSTLEDSLGQTSPSEANTPNPGFWDKILEDRERAFAEEAARNAEALGRGKRKRQNVDYGDDGLGGLRAAIAKAKTTKGTTKEPSEEGSDAEFQVDEQEEDDELVAEEEEEEEEEEENDWAEDEDVVNEEEHKKKRSTSEARSIKRCKVPSTLLPFPPHLVPYLGFDGLFNREELTVPPTHKCPSCEHMHPIGWCRKKVDGAVDCSICGIAHLGYSRTCPKVTSPMEVLHLDRMVRASNEPPELIARGLKHLQAIRADLLQRCRTRENEAARRQSSTGQEQHPAVQYHYPAVAQQPPAVQRYYVSPHQLPTTAHYRYGARPAVRQQPEDLVYHYPAPVQPHQYWNATQQQQQQQQQQQHNSTSHNSTSQQ